MIPGVPARVRILYGTSVAGGTGRIGGAAAAEGAQHRAGAGVQGQGGGVWFSDHGAGCPVGFLHKAHKCDALLSRVLDLLLGRKDSKSVEVILVAILGNISLQK